MFQGNIKELQTRVDDVCQRFANMAITSDIKFSYIEKLCLKSCLIP